MANILEEREAEVHEVHLRMHNHPEVVGTHVREHWAEDLPAASDHEINDAGTSAY
jgi:hypothetical protein